MAAYGKRIEDSKIALSLYEDLKELHRMASYNKENSAIRSSIESIIHRYCLDLEGFFQELKVEEKKRNTDSAKEEDVNKFMKDHFVFSHIK